LHKESYEQLKKSPGNIVGWVMRVGRYPPVNEYCPEDFYRGEFQGRVARFMPNVSSQAWIDRKLSMGNVAR
jgi:hypothetical protein